MPEKLKNMHRVEMLRQHNERCPECKDNVKRLLTPLFGDVAANKTLGLPCRLDDLKDVKEYERLALIFETLQRHRGFTQFVRAKQLPPVDFFLPEQNIIVEFDESQHFTKPRNITLALYPKRKAFAFPVTQWQVLCERLQKRDNDPPYRDEQRAWYDTIRDFAPLLLGKGRTYRLYSREIVWCQLDAKNRADLQTFRNVLSPGEMVHDNKKKRSSP